jgi:hypothetical protein
MTNDNLIELYDGDAYRVSASDVGKTVYHKGKKVVDKIFDPKEGGLIDSITQMIPLLLMVPMLGKL